VAASRQPSPGSGVLACQQQLFEPPPVEPPSFDELCPPLPAEQLELEVDAAIRARSQTTIDQFTTPHA
jgi:hypothetical protein